MSSTLNDGTLNDGHAAEDDPTIARLAAHRVPGGTPHLPRLAGAASMPLPEPEPDETPSVVMVGEGFAPTEDEGGPTGSFTDWSTTESLFWGHEDPAHAGDDHAVPGDPHAALGLDPDATWAQVCRAHRKLLAELHPDRFVTATEEERQDAARRLGDANQAFHQLSRERENR